MGGRAAKKEGERRGDFVGGKYLIEDCLGIGGMGEVYRATNISLGRKVAIKILNDEHTANEDDVARFLREARAAAAVRHANVVDVLDVARDDDGTPFIVQELLDGQDLEQHLAASNGRLAAEEALEIIIPVADAVAAAHAQSVVHRDLKPANIFLAHEGTKIVPKVLDFGACLYKTVGALSAKEQRMLIGTPHYMAPEQITTAVDVDARADVWAMGVILYELLVGETPFEAETAADVMKAVRTREIRTLRDVAPTASVMLESLVGRCLDRDRTKRYADASSVREELEKVKSDLKGPKKSAAAARIARADPRKEDDDAPASSHKLAAIVLKGVRVPKKRRGSSRLTVGGTDEAAGSVQAPPTSVERAIPASRAARTAADVIREAEEAHGAHVSSMPPVLSPRAAREAHVSSMPPVLSPQAARDAHVSSMPPILDPRAAPSPAPPPSETEPAVEAEPTSQASPPLSLPRPPTLGEARVSAPRRWTPRAVATLAASVLVPAALAFFGLRFAPFVLAPLGHAMRGDTPLASGVLTVLTLIGGAVLVARTLGASRTLGGVIAAVGSVLLGMVMIMVTFSAGETAELGTPPAIGSIVPFLAPLVPLGLGLVALGRARKTWLSPYERGEAVRFAIVTSLMLLAALELGPRGAVRAVRAVPTNATVAPAHRPPSP